MMSFNKRAFKRAQKYDLRTVTQIRWCTDTWNGSTRPVDGMVWDTVLAARFSRQKIISVGSIGRWFDSGRRESRGYTGDTKLANILLEFASLFNTLARAIVVACDGTESVIKSPWESDPLLLNRFLEHPSYLKLLEGMSYDEISFTFEFSQETLSWVVKPKV